MMRSLSPPELQRQRARDRFDPIVEGARHGLPRELSLSIWKRVCADATDGAGRLDEKTAQQRFHEIAARIALGRRAPSEPGRTTRVNVERQGDLTDGWRAAEMGPPVPGRETLVAFEARRQPPESLPGAGEEAVVMRAADRAAAGPRDRDGVAADAEAVLARAASSSGAPLPDEVRARFEASLGADLSRVRIHTSADSAAAASAVGARAYTVGQDIHFAEGRYAPNDPAGIHLLAHEVAHTVHQAGGAPTRQHKLEVSSPGDAAEVEADRAADAMVRGTIAVIAGVRRTARVMRDKDDAAAPGEWTDIRIKQPTTLADRTDGSPATVNLLGKGHVLAVDTVVKTQNVTAVNGAWTQIRLADDETRIGWVLSKCLKPMTEGPPAPSAPAPSARPASGAKQAHTTKPTTVSSRPAPDAANVLGDGKVLAENTALQVTGDAIAIAGDPAKRSWLPITVVDGAFVNKAGFVLSDCAEIDPTPVPAPADAPPAPPAQDARPAAEPEAPVFIRSSAGETAAVNTSVEYTIIFRTPQDTTDGPPQITWLHGRVVGDELEPLREHGFPGHGMKHAHLYEETGRFAVVAIVGVDSPSSRVTFYQNVVAADDKDSPLTKGAAANNPMSAEAWQAERDKRATVPAAPGGPLVGRPNPAQVSSGNVEFDLTALDTARSFFWYVAPSDTDGFLGISDPRIFGTWRGEWRGFALQTYRGRKVLTGAPSAPHLSFPAAQPGSYTVACEERDADGKELRTSEVAQTIGAKDQPAPPGAAEKRKEFVDETNTALAAIEGDGGAKQAQPVRAEYLAKAGGKSAHLTFFIGPKRGGGGLVLIDLQQGVSTRSYEGASTAACFAEFSSKRSYPDGRISFEVAAKPDWHIDAFHQVIEVEPSKTDKAIAIIGEIAGLAAGPLFFISPPLAAVFQIISSAADIYNNFRTGQFISERTAIDVMMMAAALVPLGEALEARLLAERLPDVAGKVNRYVRVIGFASGVPGGVMMELEAVDQLVAINRSSMSPEDKNRAMATALSNLVTQTLLLAIVVKHGVEAMSKEPPGGKKTPAFEIPGWGTMPEGTPEAGAHGQIDPARLAPTEDVATKIGGPQKVDAFAESMKKAGKYDKPPIKVVVGPDGTWYVVDGHHRLSAAKKAGMTSVQYEVVDPRSTQFKDWAEFKRAAANPAAPEGNHVTVSDGDSPASANPAPPKATNPDGNGASINEPTDPAAWMTKLEDGLAADEKAKLGKMTKGKTPAEQRAMFDGDLEASREKVRAQLRAEQEVAATKADSKARVEQLKQEIAAKGLMNDPEIRAIVDDASQKPKDKLPKLRDKLMAKILKSEAQAAHPNAEVIDGVKIYEKLPEATLDDWKSSHPGQPTDGLTPRPDGLYLQRGELDMMVVERDPAGGKGKIVAREEIKTGSVDTNAKASAQLADQSALFRDGASGAKQLRLEVGGHDIAGGLDLASDASATKSTRGPAGKGFDNSLGVTANDLEAMCKDLLKSSPAPGGNP